MHVYYLYDIINCSAKIAMFCISDQSHHQFILRSSREIQKQRKKFSAGYKRRNQMDRQKQKQKSNLKLQHYQSEEIRKKKHQMHADFSSNSAKLNFQLQVSNNRSVSNQKDVSNQSGRKRSHEFSIIMQSIKDVLKSGEKQSRQASEYKNKFNLKDDFLCLRTRLHQQFYRSEVKEQYFRAKQIQQSIIQMKRYTRHEPTNTSRKYISNPFAASNTVTCNSAVLNEPITLRKPPQLEFSNTPTLYRSVNSRRTANISKTLHKKTMAFQLDLNDGDQNYSKKIKSYLDFLFKVNFSNNIYANLEIKYQQYAYNSPRYKMFIGKGNNSLLVKSILKRRFWWEAVSNCQENDINLFWTQSKLFRIFSNQKNSKNKSNPNAHMIKKNIKINEEQLSLNRKILPPEKQSIVEQYLNSEGFMIPFEDIFTPDILTNHLPRNNSIGSKKNLFKSLFHYYQNIEGKNPFDYIPRTYHIHSRESEQFMKFIAQNQSQPNKIWIIKPGQNTNRGNSIQLSLFSKVEQCMNKQKHPNGDPFTYIIQSYINKPFLYNNRKFDIRHYMLLTSVNGLLKAYWYKEGYIRTSCQTFDLQNLSNKFIHLTNDAIQKHCQNYEKYEPANKISYNQFQRYLDYNYPNMKYHFQKDILAKMKEITIDIIKANYLIIDHKRLKNNFQIFGLDFMIDKQWRPWLIEVNYNPCLQVNCPVLERVIPGMLQNTFRVAVDPLFPPPCHFPTGKRYYLSDNYLKNLKYELIFDEEGLKQPIRNAYGYEDDQQQVEEYQDEGREMTDIHI